jgi:hypothetical protein
MQSVEERVVYGREWWEKKADEFCKSDNLPPGIALEELLNEPYQALLAQHIHSNGAVKRNVAVEEDWLPFYRAVIAHVVAELTREVKIRLLKMSPLGLNGLGVVIEQSLPAMIECMAKGSTLPRAVSCPKSLLSTEMAALDGGKKRMHGSLKSTLGRLITLLTLAEKVGVLVKSQNTTPQRHQPGVRVIKATRRGMEFP